jgi:hypothetical protein
MRKTTYESKSVAHSSNPLLMRLSEEGSEHIGICGVYAAELYRKNPIVQPVNFRGSSRQFTISAVNTIDVK